MTTNHTPAFTIYAKWNQYTYNSKKAKVLIQEVAEQQGVEVKVIKQAGVSGHDYKHTHVIEVCGNIFDALLRIRRAIGNGLCWASPNIGYCHRCHVPWSATKEHITMYDGGGCFPLCEWCWEQLTPEQRWPYYQQLFLEWEGMDYRPYDEEREGKYAIIEASVFAGN